MAKLFKDKKEKEKTSTPIKDINGPNVEGLEIDMGKKPAKNIEYQVTLDNSKEEVLELLEKLDGAVDFSFTSKQIPGFFKEIYREMNFSSQQKYMIEIAAEEAEKRKEDQQNDDKYIGDLLEVLSEPEFSGRFKAGIDDKDLREKDLSVAHVRPDEVDKFTRLGYTNIGTIEGTPVVPPESRSKFQGENMVRMVVKKDRKEAIEEHYRKKSRDKIDSQGFDGKPIEEIHYRVDKPEYEMRK